MSDRPCIEVWCRDARTDWIEEMQAGAEEEGVWMRATPVATGDAAALAQGASRASALGVGVGECSGQAMIWVEACTALILCSTSKSRLGSRPADWGPTRPGI